MKQLGLFDSAIMLRTEAFELTKINLQHYLSLGIYKKIAIAFSGGKDSTCLVTVIAHLVETKQIPLALKTYPKGWDGDEISGSILLPEVYADGSIQGLLW